MLEPKICAMCGAEFIPKRKRSQFCSNACRAESQNQSYRSYKQYEKLYDIKPTKHQPVKPTQTIAEINALARAAHMTYGQYVAYTTSRIK